MPVLFIKKANVDTARVVKSCLMAKNVCFLIHEYVYDFAGLGGKAQTVAMDRVTYCILLSALTP